MARNSSLRSSCDYNGSAKPASGYSLAEAKTVPEAIAHAKGCPILAAGGPVELA